MWAIKAQEREVIMLNRLVRRASRAGIAAAVCTAAMLAAGPVGTAAAGGYKQPSRGNDQANLYGCYDGPFSSVLYVGDNCVIAALQVPSGGQALNNGQFEITVPPETTLTGDALFAGNLGGADDCTWNGGYSTSGQTIVVSGLTCPGDDGFGVVFGANVASSVGSYTLSGDYKVNNSRRSTSNVYRYAQDPVVDVENPS